MCHVSCVFTGLHAHATIMCSGAYTPVFEVLHMLHMQTRACVTFKLICAV